MMRAALVLAFGLAATHASAQAVSTPSLLVGQWLSLASGGFIDFTEDGRFRSSLALVPDATPRDVYTWQSDGGTIIIGHLSREGVTRFYRCGVAFDAAASLVLTALGEGQCPWADFVWVR